MALAAGAAVILQLVRENRLALREAGVDCALIERMFAPAVARSADKLASAAAVFAAGIVSATLEVPATRSFVRSAITAEPGDLLYISAEGT